MKDRERPSQHGAALGKALALIERAGRQDAPELPEMCSTCAFREGCMTNQMAATGTVALNCVLGIDKDRFACHHGMKDGQPKKLCAGYIAASLAPYSFTQKVVEALAKDLGTLPAHDEVREAFDAWIAEVDPGDQMDDYARAREYEKRRLKQSSTAVLDEAGKE